MDRIEELILKSLLYDNDYMRRVIPFLENKYFQRAEDPIEFDIFNEIKDFVSKYNALPSKESLIINLKNNPKIKLELEEYGAYLNNLELEKDVLVNQEWLVEQTENWCQEKAIHNAVLDVINILDGKDSKASKGMIPKMLQDALAVSFDPHVGHDYLEDSESRYEFYHKVDSRIPFHLDYFNKVTKNGVPAKTLNVVMAGVGVGKSMFLCDLAANYLLQGKNVLYITMEMAEERIAERIDANLMNRPLDDLQFLSKEGFAAQMEKIHNKTKGKLIIKEYATGSAHVGHFRHLLNEINLKKKFKPDVIFIDYLNICASSRMKSSAGLYELVKSVSEELRGLGVEFKVPVWSATQLNRDGIKTGDPDMTNVAESMGLPATCDLLFILMTSDELNKLNQIMVKLVKNRYGDINMRNKETGNIMNKFCVGVDRFKQKLYNLEESAQTNISQDVDLLETPCKPPWDDNSEVTFDIDSPKPTQAEQYKQKQVAESPFQANNRANKSKFKLRV